MQRLCALLEVSTSGYSDWLQRSPSARDLRHEVLAQAVRESHAAAQRRYGSPRLHAELTARGFSCCVNTVAKIMQELGLRSRTAKKFRQTTDSNHTLPIADNLVNQEFTASGPNELWLTDITYIHTSEGWLYLAGVLDMFSRRLVGWSMSETMTSRLVVEALKAATQTRQCAEVLWVHSDRGSQYASEHYQELLTAEELVCSMSRRGNCYDNSPMESFWATLKKEVVHDTHYQTRVEARASLFEYIEVFYNRQRRHSALGYVSPAEFEERYASNKYS
mgnify:CR=1 FL=1